MIKSLSITFILAIYSITGYAGDKYATLNHFLEQRAQGKTSDGTIYQGVTNAVEEVRYINNKATSENCFATASQRYGVDPWLLFSMSLVESSFNPSAKAPVRSDGNRAMGLMQFDSTWIPIFKKRYNIHLTEKDFLDGCKSIMFGAWVLADNFYRKGYSWQAIGLYNAKTPWKQELYAEQVYKMYELVMKHEQTGEIYKNPKAPLKEYHAWFRDWRNKYYKDKKV